MKKILIKIILIVWCTGLFAQGVYNNGGKIVIGSGITMYISGTGANLRNETNVTNGSIDLSGAIRIEGDIINNVAASDIFTSQQAGSEVILSGTVPQTLGGATIADYNFTNLTVNNPGGITFLKNVMVNGNMNLTAGLIEIGNNSFHFGPLSVVSGSPSGTNMIIASGSGLVTKEWNSIGTFTFPVGDNTVTPDYSPVSLSFTSGTFSPGAITGVNLVNGRINDPAITGSYLNRYWNISQTGIAAFICDAVMSYNTTDIVGTEANISCLRVSPTPVSVFSNANTLQHQLSATGLTSFGTFTGGPGFKVLNLKLYLEAYYTGGGLMRQAQGVSGNQYPGTTVDQITIELHDPITYATQVYTSNNIDLNNDGSASVKIPATYNGTYYLTVKQRNSVGVVTASPLLFSSQTINYDFSTSQALAYGNNMKNLAGGVFGLYSGDSNGDGVVDVMDLSFVQNDAVLFTSGFSITDINGDGVVDAFDLSFVQNNALMFIMIINP